jgi:excisionase family DNA binding protein
MAENYLTVEELAERLKIGRSAAYELVASGHIRWVDTAVPGKRPRPRITETELDRFAEANMTEGRAA